MDGNNFFTGMAEGLMDEMRTMLEDLAEKAAKLEHEVPTGSTVPGQGTAPGTVPKSMTGGGQPGGRMFGMPTATSPMVSAIPPGAAAFARMTRKPPPPPPLPKVRLTGAGTPRPVQTNSPPPLGPVPVAFGGPLTGVNQESSPEDRQAAIDALWEKFLDSFGG